MPKTKTRKVELRERRFGGKPYRLYAETTSKAEANRLKGLLTSGRHSHSDMGRCYARVVKSGKLYVVFYRKR